MSKGKICLTPVFKNVFLAFLLTALFLVKPAFAVSGNTVVFTIGSTYYLINGNVNNMDVAPYIRDGRTFVPVRYAAQALGISPDNISYGNGKVTLTGNGLVAQLTAGSNELLLNGTVVDMDVTVDVVNGRTMLPVRWISTVFGVTVNWDPATRTVTLTDAGPKKFNIIPVQTLNPAIKVPPLAYDSSVSVLAKDYSWQYNGNAYSWQVEIPKSLLDWDEKVNSLINKFYSSNAYVQQAIISSVPDASAHMILSLASDVPVGNYVDWVNDNSNSAFVSELALRLSAQANSDGYDYFHTAEFVQSFVGGAIPYKLTDIPELPSWTLANSGDCKDKSVLLAAILKDMGYKAALLFYPPPPGQSVGHMAVGVAFDDGQVPKDREASYYLHDGIKYYFAETTEPNWQLGQISDKSLEKEGYVYQVN